ncbi:MAG: hypothetical protein WBQ26_12705 [Gemmatimonadaceae bacterium]
MPQRWVAVAVLCALALGSGFAGAALDRLVLRARPSPIAFPDTSFHPIESILRSPTAADRRAIRAELTRQLHLTPVQADSIDSIMNRRSGEFRALREEMRPRVQQLVDDVHASIEGVLTPEQRERFRRIQPTNDSSTTP